MVEPKSGSEAGDSYALHDGLSRGNAALAKIAPILSHLLTTPDHSLFSDEIVARIRGMFHDLAWQVLRAQAEAAGQAGREAFADRHGEALAEHFYSSPALLAHCHTLAIEWQLSTRLEERDGLDPVLSPQMQALVASEESSMASAAMAALAAQARFSQSQRRMELPLGELPGDLFHELLLGWRRYNGEVRSDAMIRAEAKLRNNFDEGMGRLALLSRLVSDMGRQVNEILDINRAGVALFFSALAARSGQPREYAVLSSNDKQLARFALGLRAAGLESADIETQILHLHPHADLLLGVGEISPDAAARMLAESGKMGVG